MKSPLLLLTCLLFAVSSFAQGAKDKQSYAEKAAQLQSEVWGSPPSEFKSTSVPANFSKESAVILARSFSLSRASSGKIKFGRSIGVTTRTTKFSTFHERVKINDKTALESFSTLEYQKKLDKTTSQLFAKYVNVNNTFIGAKVIKPSGKEIMVNTSEEVLTKNESKDQKGKLAIPDLQVGDVLDYYVCKEDIADKNEGNLYKDNDNLFFLVDEYPVLYYSIDFQFNKKIKVKTIYANGAQHFEESHNEEGDQLFSLKLHNVPKYQSQLWTSALRQYPYIEIGSSFDDELDKIIEKNNFENKTPMLQAQKHVFETSFREFEFPYIELITKLKDYYKDNKLLKNAPPDSVAKAIYSVWKFSTFCFYFGQSSGSAKELKYRRASSKINTINMCMALTELKIDHDVLLVASRNSNSLDNVYNYDDFDALIRINGTKPAYMYFDDIFTHYNEIPERFQGEKVIILHPKRRSRTEYTFTESDGVIPVDPSNQNNIDEKLNVSLSDQNMQKLKIERVVKETGALRDDQQTLLTLRAIDTDVAAAAKGGDMQNRFKHIGNSKKFVIALQELLDKEKDDQDKYFSGEIKGKYDQEPKEISNCKIIRTGVDASSPVFEYTETFVLDNLVKKAGNNYIIDAGKLTGGFLKLEDKYKARNVDIYMSAARSFNYSIIINIPKGYTAKGIEEMTQNKSNKTGSFSSSATIAGNQLSITVKRAYNNNFEKAADWPLMVDVINAASDFDSKKILLEKQN